jgi:hypothetical protein
MSAAVSMPGLGVETAAAAPSASPASSSSSSAASLSLPLGAERLIAWETCWASASSPASAAALQSAR